jgi:hypothetical protein
MKSSAISCTVLVVSACLASVPAVYAQQQPGVSVDAQPASPWSVEVFVGWDINVSGEFLNSASGVLPAYPTVPVAIDDTSYGDVFGTGVHWQFGVGYRLDDQNEVRAGITYQDVGSDAVRIGTAGLSTALEAEFEDYTVWSFDVGYRRYFNTFRELVRPFAGVTMGIADIPRIDGVFAAPAAGIVVHENDLYDGTAAFTFGINGGAIYRVTERVDVTGQIGFRYVSGLSDIDDLLGTGLDEINDESSRWTFPLLFGVRYRF